MANEFQITLTLEGLPSEGGHIRVDDFILEIRLLTKALKKADHHVTGSSIESSYYRVVSLHHSSPATIVVEAQPKRPENDIRAPVFSRFFSLLTNIQEKGSLPEQVSHSLLSDLSNMAAPVGKTLAGAKLSHNGNVIEFNRNLKRKIDVLLSPEETYPGALRGMLEAINIHQDANVFRIYPDIGPTKITCHFPSSLHEQAVNAVGRFIEVRGTLKYKINAPYPHEIDVDSIESFPPKNELPTLWDLKGVAPDATGPLSSEEFVRKIRDGVG